MKQTKTQSLEWQLGVWLSFPHSSKSIKNTLSFFDYQNFLQLFNFLDSSLFLSNVLTFANSWIFSTISSFRTEQSNCVLSKLIWIVISHSTALIDYSPHSNITSLVSHRLKVSCSKNIYQLLTFTDFLVSSPNKLEFHQKTTPTQENQITTYFLQKECSFSFWNRSNT